ncbi:hypothetical protein GMOD_00008639 [Pyrenophora seminiperda CCB06]|uniref:Uncharacterized protein n=1 Tax=Pyrenophora seminiperda CCB06 TaxID=1302712 RepID=A0A3M7M9A7_9PLEO|nr:hypothetical protein GMOD_00008639 [Pyrenophora seminiperda CCB06]
MSLVKKVVDFILQTPEEKECKQVPLPPPALGHQLTIQPKRHRGVGGRGLPNWPVWQHEFICITDEHTRCQTGKYGDTNQDYVDYDQYQDADQEPELDLINGDGPMLDFDYSGNTIVDAEFTNTDDSLDVITDTAWAAYYESAQNDVETAAIAHDNAGSRLKTTPY